MRRVVSRSAGPDRAARRARLFDEPGQILRVKFHPVEKQRPVPCESHQARENVRAQGFRCDELFTFK